jgi:hypothetical protein
MPLKARPGDAKQRGAMHGTAIHTTANQGFFMITIAITIEGTTPLLCNRFTDAAQMAATAGNRGALIGEQMSPQEQAQGKLYLDHTGREIIPQPNLLRCLIDAGKFFRHGKSKVTTQKSSLITSCVDIDQAVIPIQHRDPWTVDSRPVRIPATGGRILCHRPCFHDWQLAFALTVDPDLISVKLVREIVDAAGKRIGLGDFRPDCKGPFGKFVVSRWEVQP